MYGINVISSTEAIGLVLLILLPVLLWIVYKLEDIYRKKEEAKYYKDMNKLIRLAGINKKIKKEG